MGIAIVGKEFCWSLTKLQIQTSYSKPQALNKIILYSSRLVKLVGFSMSSFGILPATQILPLPQSS
jgi:hypothetical protein